MATLKDFYEIGINVTPVFQREIYNVFLLIAMKLIFLQKRVFHTIHNIRSRDFTRKEIKGNVYYLKLLEIVILNITSEFNFTNFIDDI